MRKLFKTINDVWNISDIGSVFSAMISINAVSVFFLCFQDLFSGYEIMDTLSGFFIGSTVVSIMFPFIIISAIIRDYKLTVALPVEAAKLPQAISLTVDICLLAVFIIDVILIAASGMPLRLSAYAGVTLFTAILIHIGVCGIVGDSIAKTSADMEMSPKNFIKMCVYMIFFIVAFVLKIMVVSSEYEDFESRKAQIVFMVILAVMLVLFTLFRVVTGQELRSRIRMERVYKKRKTKEPKEEGYV